MGLANANYLVLVKYASRSPIVFGYENRGDAVAKIVEYEAASVCDIQLKNTRTGCIEYRSRFRYGA